MLLAALLTCCSSAQPTRTALWDSQLYADHPLVGKIWSSADGRFIKPEQLLEVAAASRYLLLGEKHDNPDHHRLQLFVLDALLQQGGVGVVAFEMLTSDSQDRLDTIHEQRLATLDELKDYLQWDEAGWDWSFYGPLLQRSYAARVALRAANINDSAMLQVYGGEPDPVLSNVLTAIVVEKLHVDIDESHCGMLPESQFPAMVRVQQSRDNQMANALSAGSEQSVGNTINVLIAGNYHVRADLGVPNYLRNLQPDLTARDIVTISFSEVDASATDPAEYLQQFSDIRAYDFIWFTPAISDEDYCASMRQEQ